MVCIELHKKNGERLAAAGLPGDGIVTLVFDWHRSDLFGPSGSGTLRLRGLDMSSEPAEKLLWLIHPAGVGDEFVVSYVDDETADEPVRRDEDVPHKNEEYRRALAKRLEALEDQARRMREMLANWSKP